MCSLCDIENQDPGPEKPPRKPRRPNTKTIEKVLAWLKEHSFSVYGANIDPETGNEYPGCRDYYTVADLLKVARHIEKGTTRVED